VCDILQPDSSDVLNKCERLIDAMLTFPNLGLMQCNMLDISTVCLVKHVNTSKLNTAIHTAIGS